ncbi:MAG: choice-of-anchor J domain-containing protein [Bacteroidota bacterium]|jgi:hypothetical protein
MKKPYLKISTLIFSVFFSLCQNAQTINESFDNFATTISNGWIVKNNTTHPGSATWTQGTNFTPYGGAGYARCNYQSITGSGTISNWLISPVRTFNNGDVVLFYTRTVDQPSFADNLQLRLSTNDTSTNVGSDSVSVGDFTTLLLEVNPSLIAASYPNSWTLYVATVSGLTGPTNGRVALRYYVEDGGPQGTNSEYIGVDEFFAGAAPQTDVTVSNPFAEYTLIPQSQLTPLTLSAKLSNGATPITDGSITAQIYQSPNFNTPIHSVTSNPTPLAPGANANINLGSFNLPSQGFYAVLYTSSCTGNIAAANDSILYYVTVTDRDYSRDNGNAVTADGIGAGPTGYIGSKYDINTATELDSVFFAFYPDLSSVGDSTRIAVFNVSASGVPTNIIGQSDAYVITTADTGTINVRVLKINATGGGQLTLNPGKYLIASVEYNTIFGQIFCDGIFNDSTFYASWPGQNWLTLESLSFNLTPVIRPILKNITTSVSSMTPEFNFSVFPNPAANSINISGDKDLIGNIYKVYNQQGKIVAIGNVNQNKQTIDISNLSNGMYFLEIGNSVRKPFTVQNN